MSTQGGDEPDPIPNRRGGAAPREPGVAAVMRDGGVGMIAGLAAAQRDIAPNW